MCALNKSRPSPVVVHCILARSRPESRVLPGLTREQRLKLGTKSFDRLFHDQPEARTGPSEAKASDFKAKAKAQPALPGWLWVRGE